MSSRVRYAIVVVPLLGTHWSYLPAFHAWCVSVQPCGEILEELQAEVRRVGMERQHAAGAVRLVPDRIAGRQRDARGSPKPRTPRSVPK